MTFVHQISKWPNTIRLPSTWQNDTSHAWSWGNLCMPTEQDKTSPEHTSFIITWQIHHAYSDTLTCFMWHTSWWSTCCCLDMSHVVHSMRSRRLAFGVFEFALLPISATADVAQPCSLFVPPSLQFDSNTLKSRYFVIHKPRNCVSTWNVVPRSKCLFQVKFLQRFVHCTNHNHSHQQAFLLFHLVFRIYLYFHSQSHRGS